MSQGRFPVTSAATILAARRRSGEQGPRLPERCRPLQVDTALAIQAAVTKQLGDRIGAWIEVPVEQQITIRYGDLGVLTVRFTQR